jgi:hypothetical protein
MCSVVGVGGVCCWDGCSKSLRSYGGGGGGRCSDACVRLGLTLTVRPVVYITGDTMTSSHAVRFYPADDRSAVYVSYLYNGRVTYLFRGDGTAVAVGVLLIDDATALSGPGR